MRANFPECPDWFNEGLASLYEQSEDRGGHIHGRTNWRLAGLQQAIKAKSLSSFKDLCATTTSQFYNQDKGNNYAQARYLCYYLQEKGLLVKFYREFAANHKADPTGYKTLQRVLGESGHGGLSEELGGLRHETHVPVSRGKLRGGSLACRAVRARGGSETHRAAFVTTAYLAFSSSLRRASLACEAR